jgi:hypothetical protein
LRPPQAGRLPIPTPSDSLWTSCIAQPIISPCLSRSDCREEGRHMGIVAFLLGLWTLVSGSLPATVDGTFRLSGKYSRSTGRISGRRARMIGMILMTPCLLTYGFTIALLSGIVIHLRSFPSSLMRAFGPAELICTVVLVPLAVLSIYAYARFSRTSSAS